MGWSLGALNAFNLGWNHPELFATVGAFSPSFWLSSERGDAAAVQRTRLAQGMVEAGHPGSRLRRGTRWWIAAGDREAARRVELSLPDTGVCGGAGLFDAAGSSLGGACCAPPAALLQVGRSPASV